MKLALIATLLTACAVPGVSQLAAPGDSGVSMGHLHLNTKDPEAQKKFWVELMGARAAKLGPNDVFKLPGVIIMARKADPTGATDGSVVNHVGFKVRDLNAMLAKVEAAHLTILTRNPPQAMILGPDDVKVEFSEDTALAQPVAMHHIHFYTANVDEMKKWYVATFAAIPGKRGRFEAADVPGANLTFAAGEGALAPTKGRSLDHIGFEVRNLEAFVKKLEAGGAKLDIAYRKVPDLGIALAFLTDPWGTRIELTEGLDQP